MQEETKSAVEMAFGRESPPFPPPPFGACVPFPAVGLLTLWFGDGLRGGATLLAKVRMARCCARVVRVQ